MIKNSKLSKTIHLIRHGETDFNKQGIIQGSGVDSHLNEKGRWQAEMFYKAYQDKPYNRVYTSELMRAIQSVEGFINKGLPHTTHAGLNEINWGIMEGRESNPEQQVLYEEMIGQWKNGILDVSVENGETPLELFEKQTRALEFIMEREEEEMILICMHGRAMRSFLCLLTGTPLQNMEQWEHANLCLYELQYNGEYFEVVKGNDLAHLQ